MIYFQGEKLVFENYITRRRFYGTPDTLVLLSSFNKPKTLNQALRSLRDYTRDSIHDSVRNLLDSGLLTAQHSEEERQSQKFSNRWLWPTASRYYHLASKLYEPFSTQAEIRRFYDRKLKGRIQPSLYKSYDTRPRVKLLDNHAVEAPLFKTMRQRHTTREFSGEPISFKQFSQIIDYTWGEQSAIETKEFGRLLHKTSPSAGARHPVEVYPVVNNVNGIDPGIYHYSVKDHSVELLKKGDYREKCVDFAAGQSWTKDASVFFIMTAVVARTAWKYRIARVYRAFLLDIGHLSQSFLLVSTALGLGSFCIGIIGDETIEKELDLDGVNEIALFVVGVGHREGSLSGH